MATASLTGCGVRAPVARTLLRRTQRRIDLGRAPDIDWPWGPASLQFHVDYLGAGDADFLRLLDAWRQLRERWEEAAAMLRRAVLQGWRWARENLPAGEVANSEGSSENVDIERVFRQVGGCGLCLSTSGLRQVNITAYVDVEWDPEHGVEVDLIEPRLRDSWSFL